MAISETFDEDLFRRYYIPTRGMMNDPERGYKFLIDKRCKSSLTREDFKKLQKSVVIESMRIFGAKKFYTPDKQRIAEEIFPGNDNRGWGRYPGLDHWHVYDASGKTIFRTQNYCYVLAYFKLFIERHCH